MSAQVSFVANGNVNGDTDGDVNGEIPQCLVDGVLDFHNAREILGGVGKHIEENASLVIDLASVSRSNSAGLALMIEWLAMARRLDHDVTFRHIPDGLRQLAGVCQVEGLI